MDAARSDQAPPYTLPTSRQAAGLAAKGAVIGVAEAIPGVSGGTLALILGVCVRLIEAIKSYTPKTVWAWLRALPAAARPEGRPPLVARSRALHFDFLFPLGLGMAPAFLVGTKVLPGLMTEHRAVMQALFFGMILASVFVPFDMIGPKRIAHLALIVGGAVGAWVFIGFTQTVAPNPLFVFLFGAIAICALVLPGVSGSYLLHSVGLYTHISGALHEDFSVVTLGAFALGALTGLVTAVRALSWLLKRYKGATLAVLTGLMIGSLRSVWFFQRETGEVRMIKGEPHPVFENVLPEALGRGELVVIGVAALGALIVGALVVIDRRLAPPQRDA